MRPITGLGQVLSACSIMASLVASRARVAPSAAICSFIQAEIAARAEAFAGASEHHHADRRIGQLPGGLAQFADHRARESVVPFRPVQREPRHAAVVAVDGDRLVHRYPRIPRAIAAALASRAGSSPVA